MGSFKHKVIAPDVIGVFCLPPDAGSGARGTIVVTSDETRVETDGRFYISISKPKSWNEIFDFIRIFGIAKSLAVQGEDYLNEDGTHTVRGREAAFADNLKTSGIADAILSSAARDAKKSSAQDITQAVIGASRKLFRLLAIQPVTALLNQTYQTHKTLLRLLKTAA